jgi:drug/metabolite transporter (DMT)-like permease
LSFILLATIWGCSFWWIKLGLRAFTPVQVAFVRLLLGATTLLIVARIARSRLPQTRRTWKHLAVVALLLNSIPFSLFAFGQTQVTSILAGIINAVTPLAATLVILAAFPEERPTRERTIGIGIGFAGVLVVLGVWERLPSGQISGIVACLAAVACYGIAFPYARRHLSSTGETPLSLATGQVLLGATFVAPIVAVQAAHGNGSIDIITGPVIAGMLALGTLGSGVAYVLNYSVIAAAGGSVASTVTYLTPVFAAIVGTAFLDERLTWHHVIGGLVVLLGVAVAQGRVPSPIRDRAMTTAAGRPQPEG